MFFAQRAKAYAALARLLSDPGFWPRAQHIITRSLTIDFARESEHAVTVPTRWYDKPGLTMLWLGNLHNWRASRLRLLVQHWRAQRASCLLMDRPSFIDHFERR